MQLFSIFFSLLWVIFATEVFFRKFVSFTLYFSSILLLFVFSCFAISTLNLFGVFSGLEMQNIIVFGFLSLYIPNIVAYRQTSNYFLLSAFFSGFLLMGITFIYFASGTLDCINLYFLLPYLNFNFYFLFGCFLILVAFSFKLGIFPFFLRVPQVYQFCPLIGLFTLAIFSKIVYLGLFSSIFSFIVFRLNILMMFFLITSMIICTFLAWEEILLRRLFGYSAVIQTSFLFIGLLPGDIDSVTAVFFFSTIYSLNTFSIFVFLVVYERKLSEEKRFGVASLKALSQSQVVFSYFLAFILFSLAGIPPFPGFFAKLYVIFSLIQQKYFFVSFFLISSSIFLMYYYIKLVLLLFSDDFITLFESEFVFTSLTICLLVFCVLFTFSFIFIYHFLWIFCLYITSALFGFF
jgi:NADH-quinone oxidoreductase subunit N